MIAEAPHELVRIEHGIKRPSSDNKLDTKAEPVIGKSYSEEGTFLAVSDLLDPGKGNKSGEIFFEGKSESGKTYVGRICKNGTITSISQNIGESSAILEMDESVHPEAVISSLILTIGGRFLFSPFDRLTEVIVPTDEGNISSPESLRESPIVRSFKSAIVPDLSEDVQAYLLEAGNIRHLLIEASYDPIKDRSKTDGL